MSAARDSLRSSWPNLSPRWEQILSPWQGPRACASHTAPLDVGRILKAIRKSSQSFVRPSEPPGDTDAISSVGQTPICFTTRHLRKSRITRSQSYITITIRRKDIRGIILSISKFLAMAQMKFPDAHLRYKKTFLDSRIT